ncbi:MAG: hypothetical protein ACT4OM_00580 [Actinomycetota bacterium]
MNPALRIASGFVLFLLAACSGPDASAPAATAGAASIGNAAPVPEQSLDASYLACVNSAGFVLKFAQVIVRSGEDFGFPESFAPLLGRPVGVKTAPEVPAQFHRPCLMAIGGDDPHSSSYGRGPAG